MIRKEPWLTTDSITHLKNVMDNLNTPKVMEFGCGASTVWFSTNYDCELISIEHDTNWFNKINNLVGENKNTNLILKPSNVIGNSDLLQHSYASECDRFDDEYFDVILIDGRSRVDCFKHCERTLKKGGIMILDNSEREEYSYILQTYKDKITYSYPQIGPDNYNFNYNGWSTHLWVK